MKAFRFFGNRTVKTGVAIFLTALICEWLNWPPVFAVITAIVTIEPTVSDSIKKGMVRFPASVIGSAYAVLFIMLFGNSPLTYTLAAVLTIATCFKLNLHAGLLVATLTSVAMVEVIHSNYLIAFFIRLGTTTVGLLVSTGINMFIFPPDYTKDIIGNTQKICRKTGIIFEKIFRDILDGKHEEDRVERDMIDKLYQKINRTETLIRFQKDETSYHPLVGSEKSQFQMVQDQLETLRILHYQLDNLIHMTLKDISWSQDERELIMTAVSALADGLKNAAYYDPEEHHQQLEKITELFWNDNDEITKHNEQHPTTFPPELIILYELVSIYHLVNKLYQNKGQSPTTLKR